MKIRLAFFALLLAITPAAAQWQVKNHATPIGRGAGVTGFGAAVPGASGAPLVSTGATTDPAYGQAANNGIAPGVANTVKGTLDGVSTSDVAVTNCTALTSALRWASGAGFNCGTVVGVTGFDMPINLGLSASATASSSLTLTVTQANGSAPTAANPVIVPFRSTTLTSGALSSGTISGSLSLVIPNGASLGTTNSVPFRIWIFLDANSGTPALGVATCSNTTSIFPCTSWETTLKTSTTINGSATAAGTLYAAVGVSNDAVRIIGYCDYASGLTTAGTWLSACTTLQVMGPSVKKPGDVVQKVVALTTVASTQTSAGFAQFGLAQTLTPTSAPNLVQMLVVGTVQASGAISIVMSPARNSTLIGTPVQYNQNVASQVPLSMYGLDAPGTTSSTTYQYQGKVSSGTVTFPAPNTGAQMDLQEIMG